MVVVSGKIVISMLGFLASYALHVYPYMEGTFVSYEINLAKNHSPSLTSKFIQTNDFFH